MKKFILAGIMAMAFLAVSLTSAQAASNPLSLGVTHNLVSGAKPISNVAVTYKVACVQPFDLNALVTNFDGRLKYGASVSKPIFGNTSVGVDGVYQPGSHKVTPGVILSVRL